MGMSISGFGIGNNSAYKSIDTNSKQYKAAAKDHLAALIEEEAMMTPEQKMLYELLGGREAHMRNVMRNYNSDGDFVGPNGIVVPGMYHGDDSTADRSTWQQIINVSEGSRQKMFDEAKRHFLQEYGVANGDTTKRSEVFREYQLSVPKEDRAKGTWTLEQYEKAYTKAFYDAVKAEDPNWELGKPFNKSILDKVTRESVESTLIQSGNTFILPRKTFDVRA